MMKTDELVDLIKSRRSIRSWQDKAVPEDMLLRAIELATYAPNGGNQQNWFFYIILDKKVIVAIADAVQATADYIAAWPEAAKYKEEITRMTQRASVFRNDPAAIAVAAKQYMAQVEEMAVSRETKDPRARAILEGRHIANSRIQSVSAAVAYLLLILHQAGLGAVWMTGPMQAKKKIEKLLKVPRERARVAFIPVGYPAESPAPRERKPVKEVCQIIK